ncbi:hypothetical protein [Alkalilacustris brevis]|uniref:hypothetical protein n=1 Tax=Alkalilacustris brevis TaxID=2026338 RepID=UPI000E0CE06E|nr:hypothetical protein [Alkalilacustris brevis]
MPRRRETPRTGARRLFWVSALAGLVLAMPARAEIPDDLTVFLEALTASPEAANALDPLISRDDRLRLLQALARGDSAAVVDSILGLAEGRAMEELKRAVPFLGKVFLARDAGLWLSEYVWDRAATHGFETARARLSETIPRENWPRDWDSYRASGQFDAELFRSFLTHDSMVFTNAVWREHGIENADHPDAERVLFEAFWNRVLIEDAYEAAGLTGSARTPERLRAWLDDEIAFQQELALMSADSWREHLLFLESVQAQARENALRQQAEALAEEESLPPADEAMETEIAIAIETEVMELEEAMPELSEAHLAPSPPDQPDPEEAAPPAVTGFAISHGTQVQGESTQHSVSIAQDGDTPVTLFLSLAPLGQATSGGLGHGTIPEILALGVGDSWAVEIMVMGDHPGAMLSVGQGAENRTQLALLPAHEVEDPQPAPPSAPPLPGPQDDPDALWLAAPVVYEGQQRIVYRLSVGGRVHSSEWVVPGVTYTFLPSGELLTAHGGYTAMFPAHTIDETGEISFITQPQAIDPSELTLGQVAVDDGRVNVRGLIDLIEQRMGEAGLSFGNAGTTEITVERITTDMAIDIPYPQTSPPVSLRIETMMHLDRLNGGASR